MHVINQRNCQPCTACSHCTRQGCSIYDARPQDPCQSFHCAWRQEGTLLPHNMRPDLSGAIVAVTTGTDLSREHRVLEMVAL
ncbi:hypothetical protein B9Z44_09195 [Limnohabitans curvus]|uniref:Uncharacterized protein n=1 Tax=Limnohabitans curvus TaxID=323423 RepID=A0A315EUN3_9BURK|nr:hypothetical protein B9Z44_09195 [Limnohabitans curvus]